MWTTKICLILFEILLLSVLLSDICFCVCVCVCARVYVRAAFVCVRSCARVCGVCVFPYNTFITDSKLRKDSACGDLGWNGSQLAPPSGCAVVKNGVQTVFDVSGGTAVLCCPRVGHLEACQLQSSVLWLFVNVRFYSTMKESSSLFSVSSAKRNRKTPLKLSAQTQFLHTQI